MMTTDIHKFVNDNLNFTDNQLALFKTGGNDSKTRHLYYKIVDYFRTKCNIGSTLVWPKGSAGKYREEIARMFSQHEDNLSIETELASGDSGSDYEMNDIGELQKIVQPMNVEQGKLFESLFARPTRLPARETLERQRTLDNQERLSRLRGINEPRSLTHNELTRESLDSFMKRLPTGPVKIRTTEKFRYGVAREIYNSLMRVELTHEWDAAQLFKYLDKTCGRDEARVKFKKNTRYFAVGPSLSNMSKELKNVIADKSYCDIDMANCGPTIFNKITILLNHPCHNLQLYIAKREQIIEELRDNVFLRGHFKGRPTRADIKKAIISIIYGSRAFERSVYDFLATLTVEIVGFYGMVRHLYAAPINKIQKETNKAGAYLSNIVYTIESSMLWSMYLFFESRGISMKNAVPCHDGIMINHPISNFMLRDLEKKLEADYGFRMLLKNKPMNDYGMYSKFNEVQPRCPDVTGFMHFERLEANGEICQLDINELIYEHTVAIKSKKLSLMLKIDSSTDTRVWYDNVRWESASFNDYINMYPTTNGDLTLVKIVSQDTKDELIASKKLKDKHITESSFQGLWQLDSSFNLRKIVESTLMRAPKKFKKVDSIPYLHQLPERRSNIRTFNTFQQFHFRNSIRSTSIFTSSKIFSHIRKYMCSNNQILFEYLMNFIAHSIQKPAEVPGVCIIFKTEQGVGKDTLANFIQSLIGYEKVCRCENSDNILKNFNKEMSGKMWMFINELRTGSFTSSTRMHNLVKSMLTKEIIRIEGKGENVRAEQHYTRYMFFTNNNNTVYIEPSNRRFLPIESDSSILNEPHKIEHFNAIYAEIGSPLHQGSIPLYESAFHYFATRDLSNYKPGDLPKSSASQNMKLQQLVKPIRFLIESETAAEYITDSEVRYPLKILYRNYRNWCEEIGEKPQTRKSVISCLADTLKLYAKQIRIHGLGTRCLIIPPHEVLQKKMRDYLKIPEYELHKRESGARLVRRVDPSVLLDM